MLSYRHGFHAGNHADVLKHLVLVAVVDYLTGKPKPIWFVDTHAGAGVYDLRRGFAAHNGEYGTGVGRLWDSGIATGRSLPQASGRSLPQAPGRSLPQAPGRSLPQAYGRSLPQGTGEGGALERYVGLVRGLNGGGRLRRYPGSPWLVRELARADDRLWLFELHPADFSALNKNLGGKGVSVAREDGLQALRGLLPPQPKRALVLIDPSYEVKTEYRQVVVALREALQRFPTGTCVVWYPLLELPASRELPVALRKLVPGNWLDARLQVRTPGPGMYGSGMFVINPPYTLPQALEPALESLVRLLGQDEAAEQRLEWNIV